MASEVADLFVILRAETAPFVRGMKDAGVAGESFGSKMGGWGKAFSKLGAATAAVGVGFAVTSVKMAADFQTQMTRLYTAAGLTQSQLKALGMTSQSLDAQVLKIGTSVGFTGTEMATALYHPISAGLDLKTALQVVTYAAEEAKISGASLEDTTYSLSSVMKAFNEPASQAKQTMSDLNSIVGQGDMRFQDFNQSIKNWAPTAAQMGISINSMGAGLAYLTDRGNSAEVASTRLTMGISMMTTPSAQAAKLLVGLGVASTDVKASSSAMTEALKKAHITQNQLAMDLKKPDGLYVALNDLKSSLEKAGVSGTEADSVLAKIFGGGRSDKAIMSLMQNLDGLKGKFQDIEQHANGSSFDQAWAKTQATFSQQMAQMKAGVENLAIAVGLKLIPVIQKTVAWFQQHKTATNALAMAIGTVLAGSVLKFISGALKPLGSAVKGLGKLLGKVPWGSLGKGAARAAKGIGGAFGKIPWSSVGGGAKKAARGIADAFGKIPWSDLAQGAKGLGGKIAEAASAGGKAAWSGLLNALSTVGGAMKTAALWAVDLGRKVLAAGVSAARSAIGWVAEKVALVASAIAEKAAAAAEWLLNFALDANPIMLIVIAIAALVAAIVYAYTHFKWFREGVQEAFKIIGAVTLWLWHNVFEPAFKAIGAVAMWLWHNVILPAARGIGSAFSALASGASAAFSWIIHAGEGAARWLMALPGKILGWFASAGQWLWNAGVHLIEGLWNGIVSMGSWITDQITGFIKSVVPGPVLKILGIFSPSRVFHEIGVNVTKGLVNGITAGHQQAANASAQLARSVVSGAGRPTIGLGIATAAGSANGAGLPPIIVQVDGKKLFEIVQTQALRYGRRNPTTGLLLTNR